MPRVNWQLENQYPLLSFYFLELVSYEEISQDTPFSPLDEDLETLTNFTQLSLVSETSPFRKVVPKLALIFVDKLPQPPSPLSTPFHYTLYLGGILGYDPPYSWYDDTPPPLEDNFSPYSY